MTMVDSQFEVRAHKNTCVWATSHVHVCIYAIVLWIPLSCYLCKYETRTLHLWMGLQKLFLKNVLLISNLKIDFSRHWWRTRNHSICFNFTVSLSRKLSTEGDSSAPRFRHRLRASPRKFQTRQSDISDICLPSCLQKSVATSKYRFSESQAAEQKVFLMFDNILRSLLLSCFNSSKGLKLIYLKRNS